MIKRNVSSANLFAADAVFGKLLIIAGAAVNVTSFGEETLRSYWQLTAETGETLIVPRVPFVLHTLCACRRCQIGRFIRSEKPVMKAYWLSAQLEFKAQYEKL